MSHYYAERFFAPILVSPIINGDNLEVWAVCDSPTGSLELQTTALHWTSFNPTNSSKMSVPGCPSAGAHIQVFGHVLKDQRWNDITDWCSCFQVTMPMDSLLSWGECHPGSYDLQRLSYCFFSFQLLGDQHNVLSQNSLFAPPNGLRDPDFGLQEPNIRVSGIERINNILEGPYIESYSIKVMADFPAIFVWLEAPGIPGRFSDNGFHQVWMILSVILHHTVLFPVYAPARGDLRVQGTNLCVSARRSFNCEDLHCGTLYITLSLMHPCISCNSWSQLYFHLLF